MIFLSKEEAANYIIIHGSRTTKVAAALARLNVGEGVVIEKGKDWVSKTPPNRVINNFARKHNRKFEKGGASTADGWAVKRLA